MALIFNYLNNCYFSVVLHILSLFPAEFFNNLSAHHYFHSHTDCIHCQLWVFYQKFHTQQTVDASGVFSLFAQLANFRIGALHDANEAFMFMMDWFSEEFPTLTSELNVHFQMNKLCHNGCGRTGEIHKRLLLSVEEALEYREFYPHASFFDVLTKSQKGICPCGEVYCSSEFLHTPKIFGIELPFSEENNLFDLLNLIPEDFDLEANHDYKHYQLNSVVCYRSQHYVNLLNIANHWALYNDDQDPIIFETLDDAKNYLLDQGYYPTTVVFRKEELNDDWVDYEIDPNSMNFAVHQRSPSPSDTTQSPQNTFDTEAEPTPMIYEFTGCPSISTNTKEEERKRRRPRRKRGEHRQAIKVFKFPRSSKIRSKYVK